MLTVCEVLGIEGPYGLSLPEKADSLVALDNPIKLNYAVIESSQPGTDMFNGELVRLSATRAEARLQSSVPAMSNLQIHLIGTDGVKVSGVLYAKVVEAAVGDGGKCGIHFTSMSPEIEMFLRAASVTSLGITANSTAPLAPF